MKSALLDVPHAALLDAADAGYDLVCSDEAWVRGVLEALRPVLDHGSFVHGVLMQLHPATLRAQVVLRGPPALSRGAATKIVQETTAGAEKDLLQQVFSVTRCSTVSEFYRTTSAPPESRVPPGFGIADVVGLNAIDASGIGCNFMGALPTLRRIPQRDQRLWARAAAHLGTALRLRERLRAKPEEAPIAAADAVLDARLRVVHRAESLAPRSVAQLGAAARDVARRHDAGDAARGLEAWRALLSGRWSLVDTVDTDRKRFFVLRRNEPSAPGPRSLTPIERTIVARVAFGDSNKSIAYELGLAESTVSRAVASVCGILGVRSRAELAQLGRALGGDSA